MREAAKAFGISFSGIVVTADHTGAWGDAGEAGYARTRALMEKAKPPTALVFDAIAGAHAGIRALREKRLAVPDDVSVLVSATEHPFARYDWPRIGDVSVPPGRLVEQAMALFGAEASSPRIVVAPEVFPRESVKGL